MPNPRDDELAAHAADEEALDASDDIDDVDDPSNAYGQPPATQDDEDPRKTLRDRLARQGRDLQSAKQAAQQAMAVATRQAAQIEQLTGHLQQMGQKQSQQEQARFAAYLNSLPPAQRQAAEVHYLKQQVAALSRSQRAPRVQEEDADAYTARRAQELAAEANDDFGLDGDEAVTGDEDELDWDSEETFKRSLRKLARQRALGNNVAKKRKTAAGAAEENDVEDRVTRNVLSTIGGRSNSSRPAAAASRGRVDVMKESARIFDSTRGMSIKDRQKKLREMNGRVNDRLKLTGTR